MRYLASVRAACVVAAACLFPFALEGQSAEPLQKALVYCPVSIDAVGCTNISAVLAEKYPGGVDLGYDGTSGTVDLRTANLWQYEVVVVPSLADNTESQPYSLLRDPVVAERLRDALMGRIAMWSGTPDLGTATSPNRAQKNLLIGKLAGWASANYATVKGPGLVTFLDQSETAIARYDWVLALTRVNVIADLTLTTYASVSALTATGTSMLTNGDALLAYTNMASFGFQLPAGGAGVSLDAVGRTGTTVGGQVVLLTSLGGNTGGAIVKTDLDDYAPGTTVVMTGSGWQPGETVSLTLHEDPGVHANRAFTTVADASGNIEFTGFAPEEHDIDVRFILTAVGGSSGLRAQTTFTDGVTFAGSTTADNGAGGTSLMVGKPTGVAVGDLMLAQITFTGGNTVTTLTSPAGWTPLPRDNSGSVLGQVIYWKVAQASEPASYTWGFSASSKATGGIIRYSAVDIGGNLNPIAASGSASGTQPAGVTTTLEAPSITVPTRSTMVVTFFGVRADAALSTPIAMTERHQRANTNAAAPAGPSILASDVEQFDTGETGTSTSTASGRGAWVAHSVAIDWRQVGSGTGGSSSNVIAPRPPDATAGDFLLANIAFRGNAAVTVTPPTGWNFIAKRTNTGTPLTHATYWRIAGASEPTDYTWTLSANIRSVGVITAYSNIDTDNPIDVYATNPTTDQSVVASADMTASSITTTSPSTVVAALYALDASTNVATAPAGMLLRYQVNSSTTIKVAAADALQSDPGASGSKVATAAAPVRWVAQTIAVRRRRLPTKLVFTTTAQSGLVNACLGPITIQTQDEYDRPANVVTNLAVNLATSGNGGFFTASGCTTPPASSATIASGTSSTSVWYKALVLGTGAHELSAAASGMVGASQVQTIAGQPVVVPPATVTGILVRTTETSQFSPASPDPSGIAYAGHLGRLVLVDGEVDEMPIYAGASVFETTPSGGFTRSWATASFSSEPVGAAYNPTNRHLFLADDEKRKIFEIDPGADGQYSTADDHVTSFDTHAFGSDDPEGLAFDGAQGVLFIADGVNTQVYRVSPGTNGIFDGVAPAGDDQVSSFDTEVHGLLDPEGIAYDSESGHLYVVGIPKTRVFELSTTGALLNVIDISAAGAVNPAGLEYLPGNGSSGPRTLFIVDRGVDNDVDPSENDGRMYEFTLPSASGNYLPAVTVTSPPNGSAYTQGSAITFTGTASDVESGNLTAGLTWSSSRDGALGSGGSVSTSGLSVGTHTITASVTDGNGGQASATIAVTVNSVVIPTAVGSITASSSIYGGTTNFSAAVSPAVAGSVAFFVGGSVTPIAASYNPATGSATVSGYSHGLAASASAYAVRAVFTPAGGNYQGSEASNAAALAVAPASQVIGFDLGGVTAKYGDAPFPVAALASGGASGNAVTFAGATPGTCSVTPAGQVTIAGTGLCTITASQDGNTNYAPAAPVTRSFTIGARALTVTATGINKEYDGTTAASVTLADNRIAGDALTTAYTGATFADKNVGTAKTISVNGIAISGAAAANYTVNTTATATASIAPRLIAVEADAKSKVYGDVEPELTYHLTSGSLVAGESFTGALTRAAGTTVAGSPYAIQQGTLNAGTNYQLSFSGANLTIAPRLIAVQADAKSKVYGDVEPELTYHLTSGSLVAGESLTGTLTRAAGTTVAGSPYAIQQGTLSAGSNYDLSFSGANVTVTPRLVTATIVAGDKVYDGSATATITGSVVNAIAEDEVGVTGLATFSDKNVGNDKVVTATGLTLAGAQANNYALSSTTAVATADITARPLVVTASAQNKVYDGTAMASVTLADNRVAGDALSTTSVSASFSDRNVGTAKMVTVSGISLGGLDRNNYTFNTATTTTANITARPLTITATAANKVYDGTTAASVTLSDNRVSGDALTATPTTASFADPNVGTGKVVSVSGIALSGADALNYTFNTTAVATANITPASATITLGNLSQLWDGAAKTVTAAATPSGMAVTLTYSQNGTPVAAPTNAGFYDVVATINNPNYQGTATAILVIRNRIDIMPGNSMNIISIGDTKTTEIVAAILGTVTFDARTVVPSSVTLGDGIGTDAPVNTSSTGTLRASVNDVNADGRADLVLYFKKATVMSTGNVTTSTTELIVRGTLTNGAPIKGSDKVTVYP